MKTPKLGSWRINSNVLNYISNLENERFSLQKSPEVTILTSPLCLQTVMMLTYLQIVIMLVARCPTSARYRGKVEWSYSDIKLQPAS